MKDIAIIAWCFFLVALVFGIWTIPLFIGWVIFCIVFHYYKYWKENRDRAKRYKQSDEERKIREEEHRRRVTPRKQLKEYDI